MALWLTGVMDEGHSETPTQPPDSFPKGPGKELLRAVLSRLVLTTCPRVSAGISTTHSMRAGVQRLREVMQSVPNLEENEDWNVTLRPGFHD